MAKYIKKKALKNAIDCCTWYHINKSGELVEGANSAEHEPLYKYSDIKKIIKGLPTRKFEDEPNSSEKPNNCEDEPQTEKCPFDDPIPCEWVNCPNSSNCPYKTKTEPQTDCLTCRYNSDEWDSPKCDECSKAHSNYEPQTDCAWK